MSLSKQQRDARIAKLLADGVPVDRIADETGASPATVYRRRRCGYGRKPAALALER